jgi:hypothetical protein
MNPKLIQQVIDAIEKGDGQAALDLLKQALVEAASGGAEQDAPASAGMAAKDPAAPGAAEPPVAAGSAEYKAMRKRLELLEANEIARDLDDRRAEIVGLIACRAESPATAWLTREADPAKGITAITAADRIPVPRLMAEPLAELRARVVALGKNAKAWSIDPPEGAKDGGAAELAEEVAKLSAVQISAAKARGLTPEAFVIARRAAVRTQPKGSK